MAAAIDIPTVAPIFLVRREPLICVENQRSVLLEEAFNAL
jgi:hypothetical protein